MCLPLPAKTRRDQRVLAWIRHGEYAQPDDVPSAHVPHGLTAHGRDQALAAAQAVWQFAQQQGLELAPTVDCSCLRRAWETAHLMTRELHRLGATALAVHEFEELAERSLGAAANLTIAEIEAVLADDPRFEVPAPGWKREPSYRLPLPGAESLEEAGRRVARHVSFRMRQTRGKAQLQLFVGHGGAFRHAARALGLLSCEEARQLSMQHASPIYFEHHAAETGDRLVHVSGEWRRRSADQAHD
jgi:2,3-bisphosphoglycerate-dependent phosphoglycerate mutase